MMPPADDADRWRAAQQLRRDRPGWVVIWLAQVGCYHAYPLFRARRGLVVTAATPEEAAVQMDEIENAARQAGHRPVGP
jgi:hypothetical protein